MRPGEHPACDIHPCVGVVSYVSKRRSKVSILRKQNRHVESLFDCHDHQVDRKPDIDLLLPTLIRLIVVRERLHEDLYTVLCPFARLGTNRGISRWLPSTVGQPSVDAHLSQFQRRFSAEHFIVFRADPLTQQPRVNVSGCVVDSRTAAVKRFPRTESCVLVIDKQHGPHRVRGSTRASAPSSALKVPMSKCWPSRRAPRRLGEDRHCLPVGTPLRLRRCCQKRTPQPDRTPKSRIWTHFLGRGPSERRRRAGLPHCTTRSWNCQIAANAGTQPVIRTYSPDCGSRRCRGRRATSPTLGGRTCPGGCRSRRRF